MRTTTTIPETALERYRGLVHEHGSATVPFGLAIEFFQELTEVGVAMAARHAELAADAGVPFARLRPPEGLDWNDVAQQGRGP